MSRLCKWVRFKSSPTVIATAFAAMLLVVPLSEVSGVSADDTAQKNLTTTGQSEGVTASKNAPDVKSPTAAVLTVSSEEGVADSSHNDGSRDEAPKKTNDQAEKMAAAILKKPVEPTNKKKLI